MKQKNNREDILQRIADPLADSVLGLSDDAMLAETGDAEEEAERTRTILKKALQKLETVNRRLSSLGHTVNPSGWRHVGSGYQNACITCGSFVSLKITTGDMRGEALGGQCPERDQYTIRRREASRT
jgi:hypothetical protein